jgi:P4 family phage/plasmid primase-like protien
MTANENFRAAMCDAGLGFSGEILADGVLRHFRAAGDHKRNSWYVFFPANSVIPAAGAFGCWKRDIKEKWCEKRSENLSSTQRQAIREAWKLADEERRRTEKERQEKARKAAAWIWGRAKQVTAHSYIAAKNVKVMGDVREDRGALVLPLRDANGELHSLQFIDADGAKKFLPGGRIAGCFFTLADKPDGALVICEGYATGASIHEATGFAVVCAMNCGNLLAVSKALREKFQEREIIIAADNDCWKSEIGNPGLDKATEAAKVIHAKIAVPRFATTITKPTDFNDLHQLEGLHIVKTQLESATAPMETDDETYQRLAKLAPQCDASTEPEVVLGQDGRLFLTPSQWFSQKYPALVDAHGNPVREEADKDGVPTVKDIGEDFLAATLGGQGTPEAPTIFLPTEEKFYSYSTAAGIFTHQHEPVLLARLSRELLECARACHGNCETQKLEFQFRDSGHLSGVLKKARGLLPGPHDYFSTSLTEFIPCANGMLRLTDKGLLPFDPKYRRRNKLAVPFDPTAKCPKFLNTLMRPALDDIDLDLLQRWCGLALIGENLAQKLLILIGTAGGGKGTFINVLVGIIGQINLATLRPHLLGERFELSRFLGKTLLYGADVADNFLNQRGASVLKSLTGYDPITLEFKNSNEQPSIICRFNVIVTCNSRLTVHLEGDTEAWRRRLAIIQYNKPKPERVIADLGQQILAEEAPGVLNWMLEGVDKIRADEWQLRLTANQQAAVDNLLLESDGHAVFARECLSRDASQSLTVPDCFAAYVEFCNQRGWTALTKNKFGTVIGDVIVHQFGITPSHDIRDASGKSQRGWRGIALVENSPEPTEEIASEVSENHASDGSDTFFPVQPAKKLVEEFA